jgi:hypothetical protein
LTMRGVATRCGGSSRCAVFTAKAACMPHCIDQLNFQWVANLTWVPSRDCWKSRRRRSRRCGHVRRSWRGCCRHLRERP